MADRPVIFSGPMVQALLAGRKSMTRRVLSGDKLERALEAGQLPYAPGDRLYVREAFSYETLDVDRNGFLPPWYWADGNPVSGDFTRPKPSIHMPRWASRITLTVTEVRVQRLQEISEEDAVAEGISAVTRRFPPFQGCPQQLRERTIYEWTGGWSVRATDAYRALWNSLHGPDAWGDNPWVVAVSFSVRQRNIDAA